ncbi:VWA domain-containing protein [Aureibacillus halotolerans]|uniref:von Willebrand factor type A domain-containing protein n=1 Tax=Aureibacillus halotolerans TaxID=1508390 RepID=A0A4R6TVD5_9BACI|nr:VWA domain-containing protein [Aureibacillus halotolerans]TDQ37750.1 von Willebrand factor type A domain-containing protein [Aureibacillus halotolerans]
MISLRLIVRSAFAVVITIFILSGCTDNQEPSNNENANNKELEKAVGGKDEQQIDSYDSELPENVLRPETMDALVSLPVGPFAGSLAEEYDAEEVKKALDTFPKITGEASQQERETYVKNIIALFAEDYTPPSAVTDQWRIKDLPPPPAIQDGRYQLKPNLNVEIVLDASGSMAEGVDGDTKMALAKEAIQRFSRELPEEANVGLRVFGHKGTTAFADKEISCQSSALFYDIQPYDDDKHR